jgi:hypothetical protein
VTEQRYIYIEQFVVARGFSPEQDSTEADLRIDFQQQLR